MTVFCLSVHASHFAFSSVQSPVSKKLYRIFHQTLLIDIDKSYATASTFSVLDLSFDLDLTFLKLVFNLVLNIPFKMVLQQNSVITKLLGPMKLLRYIHNSL